MTVSLCINAIGILFKAAVSLGLIGWLLYTRIDLSQIELHWRETQWGGLLFTAPSIFLANTAISARRWGLVLGLQGIHVPFWSLITIYTRSAALGSFVPGGVFSGDIYRMYSLAKRTGTKTASVSSVLMDRAIGFVSLLICSVAAFYYTLFNTNMDSLRTLAEPVFFATLVFIGGIVASVVFVKGAYLTKIASKNSIILRLQESVATIPNYFSNKRMVYKILFLSLALQFGIILWTYAISLAMNVIIPFQILCMTVPLISLFVLLPVSIGGFGVREAAFVFFLTPFGVTAPEAVSISLISAIFQIGLLFLTWFGLSFVLHEDTKTANSTVANKSQQR